MCTDRIHEYVHGNFRINKSFRQGHLMLVNILKSIVFILMSNAVLEEWNLISKPFINGKNICIHQNKCNRSYRRLLHRRPEKKKFYLFHSSDLREYFKDRNYLQIDVKFSAIAIKIPADFLMEIKKLTFDRNVIWEEYIYNNCIKHFSINLRNLQRHCF